MRKRLSVTLTMLTDAPIDAVRSTRFWSSILGTYGVVEQATATPVKGPLTPTAPRRRQVNRTR